MITNTNWMDTSFVERAVAEKDLMVLTPYKNAISIMLKHGTNLVFARHDGTDEKGDIEMLKILCLYRYSGGGTDV